jgi:lipopolysaccharide biosynthesis glycosyltransferase
MDDFVIFTELVGCGEIGKQAVKTFYEFHDLPLTVIGLENDKIYIEGISDKINFVDVTKSNIYSNYHSQHIGHAGTATLWANVIQQTKHNKIIHFDSDVIFRGNIIDEIINMLDGFDLVGSIRNFKYNPHNRDDVRPYFDLSQTYCFGFNKDKLTQKPITQLKSQILGLYNPQRRPSIDFFDQVMQEIVLNGGKRYFLDNDLLGGFNYFGSKENIYGSKNKDCDYGDKIIHYASAGSGKYFYDNSAKYGHNYESYALKKYALYCKTVFNKELPNIDISCFKGFYE